MSHTYTRCHFHVVFSTKERQKVISKEVQPRLWSYITGICHNQKMIPVAVGGMDDHAHLLFHLPPTMALSKAVLLIKANSSKRMNEHGNRFAWQKGFGAFSVSESALDSVANYIRTQEKHHTKMSFEEEFLALLRKHKIEYDPKYVFG